MIAPLGNPTEYEVDGEGNVVKITDALGHETEQRWRGSKSRPATKVSQCR